MKKYLYIILIGLFFMSSSCSDFLQKDPPVSVSDAVFWKNKTQFDYAIAACFSVAYDWPGVISQILPCLDNLTDNSYCQHNEGTYGNTQTIAQGDLTPDNGGFPSQMYSLCYKGIGRVQQMLYQLEKYKGSDISADQRKFYNAQCKALRGYYYHWLFLCYKEVPLVTELLTIDNMYQPKATRAAIKAQVIKDFDDAIANLSDDTYSKSPGYFTKGALLGLKARILIYDAYEDDGTADGTKMAEVLPILQSITGYTLSANFRSNFISIGQKNNTEIMYSVRYLQPNLTNDVDLYYGAWGTNMVTRDLVNEFEYTDGVYWGESTPLAQNIDETMLKKVADTNTERDEFQKLFVNRDIRLKESIFHSNWLDFTESDFTTRVELGTGDRTKTNFSLKKLLAPCTNDTKPGYASVNDPDIVIIRYAHVLLMLAEAENEVNGATSTAYSALDAVRKRVGQPEVPAGLTKEQFRERVRKEWRVETAFEGLRYFQMKQWNLMDKLNTYRDPVYVFNTVWKSAFKYWPIPQGEIDKAGGILVQDPTYTN